MKTHFDVIWIGTGQATMSVVPKLLAAGKTVAVIESGHFGGTCVNHGCTPTKTLVASAYAIHTARRGEVYGFTTGVEVDFAKVMSPQKNARQRSSNWIEKRLEAFDGCTVFRGWGSFMSSSVVQVNQLELTADRIVVHTGTRPRKPDIDGLESIPWLTNESILDLEELPAHLAIVGGSYIALEFAQIFRRLGSRVTLVIRGPRLLSREDQDLSELVEEILVDEGIQIIRNCRVEAVSPDEGITLTACVQERVQTLKASHVLFAIGRTPNSDRVNAAAAGLQLTPSGHIEVNDYTQTNIPQIYALGDINGQGAFTHTSVNDGEIFWDHYSRLMGLSQESPVLDRKISTRTAISSLFIDPPLARVGLDETQARQSGRRVLMATMPMRSISRAREKRETYGMVKILVDGETEQILGATLLGTGGDEVIGAFAAFIQTGASYRVFRRVVFPHPTVTELMPWCLDGLQPLV